MRIAVCIATFRRPEGLRGLLDGINRLTFVKYPVPSIRVIVVDNDTAHSAAPVCDRFSPGSRWPVEYCLEPRRGIAQARNRAIACAGPDTDFVAFIDDDEIPEPYWLDDLLDTQRCYDADMVAGPVLPLLPEGSPHWLIRGRFFNRPRYATGQHLQFAGTGNVLIRSALFWQRGLNFNERFGLGGGEDADFSTRAVHTGLKIVWADEAIVYESVPPSRANARWILQRAYRVGNSTTWCETEMTSRTTARVIRAVKGSGRVVQGLLLSLPSLLIGRHALVKALQYVFRGAGMLAGLAGSRYEEYRTTDAL